MVTGYILFKLDFKRHSWKVVKKLMEMAKEAMKKQFDKKRQNPQDLKKEDNVWLKAKNIHLK